MTDQLMTNPIFMLLAVAVCAFAFTAFLFLVAVLIVVVGKTIDFFIDVIERWL